MLIFSHITRHQQTNSLITLRQSHEQFIVSSKAIDWNSQSRLTNGSATEKPLSYYVDNSFDILYYVNIYEQMIHFNELHLNVRDASLIAKFSNDVTIAQSFRDRITEVLLNSHFVCGTDKVRNKSWELLLSDWVFEILVTYWDRVLSQRIIANSIIALTYTKLISIFRFTFDLKKNIFLVFLLVIISRLQSVESLIEVKFGFHQSDR